MIEFDYEIIRDEGDEVKVYVPGSVASPLASSTATIEGPNSSGKSTLLHLIALGFHGLDEEDLATPLRERLEDIINNDKITFDIKIKDTNGEVILRSQKNDGENNQINTFSNFGDGLEKIKPDNFQKNYKLIYDIPDNPTERIEQIADDVKYQQTDIANNLSNFRNHAREILEEIMEGRNPNQIEKMKKELNDLELSANIDKKNAYDNKNDFDFLAKYAYPKLLQSFKDQMTEVNDQMERVKKSTAAKRTAKTKSKNKYDVAVKTVDGIFKELQNEYKRANDYIRTVLDKSEYDAKEWLNADFIRMRNEYQISTDFVEKADELSESCNKIYSQDKEAEQTTNFYSQVIETLKEATKNEIKMPKLGVSLDKFISELEELKLKTQNEARKAKNARFAMESLDKIVTYSNSLRREHFATLLKLSEESEDIKEIDDASILRQQQGNILKKKKIEIKINEYKLKCAEYGISEFEHAKMLREHRSKIEKYLGYTEEQLSDELEYLENEVKNSTSTIEKYKFRKTRLEERLERLENKKPHKLEKQKEALENVMNYVGSLERKFLTTFSKNLANYRGKKKLPNASNFPEEHQTAKLYYDGVSDYLGSKLESIRHIDGNYEVSKVDLVSGKIITKSGKEIRLKVMGTGQTQSTYLQSKLKENYGNRKLIVMFDEVGMMDGTSMEPIKELIRKLKESGNLLVGLVVQRLDSGVKITPI